MMAKAIKWGIEFESYVLTQCPVCGTEQTPTQTILFYCVACGQPLFDGPKTRWGFDTDLPMIPRIGFVDEKEGKE